LACTSAWLDFGMIQESVASVTTGFNTSTQVGASGGNTGA
jgi:hypothetical protein